jgi:RNA polymerase sigma-70 factor (ECF subfamily)
MNAVAKPMPVPSEPDRGSRESEHRQLMAKLATSPNREAFEVLFVFYAPRVKALMLKAGANPAEAEDLVQDVMVSVWSKASAYSEDRGSVSAWIFAIARNARIDRLRRRSSQPHEDIDEIELKSEEPSSEGLVIGAQVSEQVSIAIRDLPPEQRTVIELAYLDNLPQSEIGRRLNVPLGTIKSRTRLAFAKLREKLEYAR